MTTAIICTAILGAMVFALGFNVSRLRGATAKAGGSQLPTDPTSPLFIAVRSHANQAEYVPTLIVLFLLVGARGPAAVAIPLIVGATVVRVLHAYNMLTHKGHGRPTPIHLFSAIGTYVFGVALAVAALFTL
ncbi:MAPEG family protein [Frankia sp. CNm7]|uniref:MAPEG family protein n=1 Tax=Frankia nepalensis TaxID=1836974 RepID=A0A937RDX9_9ACTN|nr:MAPEG family protein [Frankia nepalensis]MBL7501284.1 MAPEG family protein [Frankia nepalensis]MBL7510131.1 MAPEG family protein [Frankia nepalensis]MBL7520298.1 MAPEG family protein [Frankia nepalensis]MBL7627094.1 MAPEG family protein [Frankia nepalensis]